MKALLFKTVLMAFLWLSTMGLRAQTVKPLTIGSELPNLTLNLAYNQADGKIQTKDLKGKVVIFDFWNTTCTSCIQDFPRLEKLQKAYQGKLVIILVTRDKKEKVEALFKKSTYARTTLPIVTNDQLLIKYFEVKLPHQAWINQDGKVMAVAGAHNLTEINIQKAINREQLGIPHLKQFLDFDNHEALAQLKDSIYQKAVNQYSVFTKRINGLFISGGNKLDPSDKKVIKRSFYNQPIISLIRAAYDNFEVMNNKFGYGKINGQIVLNVADTTKFIPPHEIEQLDNWNIDNQYCYEIRVLPKDADQMAFYMQEDLKRFLRLQIEVKYRKAKGMVLKRIDEQYTFKTNNSEINMIVPDDKQIVFLNQNMDEVVGYLNRLKLSKSKIVNQTAIHSNFDLTIPIAQLKEVKSLNVYLSTIGLILEEGEFDEPYLLISDK